MIIEPQDPNKLKEFLQLRPLILYGMGDMGRRIAQWCDNHGLQYLQSDKNPELQKELGGNWIVPQNIVRDCPTANVVIASIVYASEIKEDLLRLGVAEEQILQPCILMPDKVEWKDIEYNGYAAWDRMQKRFQMIAEWGWIPNKIESVADYGAGHKLIKDWLPAAAVYYPIDFIDRGDNTIICDFNKQEFPGIHSELSACTGVLMYIQPAEELVAHICSHTERWIIFSFITLEGMPDIDVRRKLGMCQNFTERQVIDMFTDRKYELRDKRYDPAGNLTMTLFLFEKVLTI